MAQTYKTDGIILKRWAFKERDKLLRVFTRDYGKKTLRAISAQKAKSKLSGHLEPFIYTQLHIAHSKTIDIVAGSDTIAAHPHVRMNPEQSSIAHFFAEIVDALTHDEDKDSLVFEFILATINWLDEHEANPLVLYGAILQLLPLLGYFVELEICHSCKKPVTEEGNSFVFKLWNIECGNCSSLDQSMSLSTNTIKILRFISENEFDQIARLRVEGEEWKQVDELVRSLLHYHIDRELKSEHIYIRLLQISQEQLAKNKEKNDRLKQPRVTV